VSVRWWPRHTRRPGTRGSATTGSPNHVIGEGSADFVLGPATFGSIDAEWEEPEWAHFYRRLASFCRVIRFDPRGSGSSDPIPLDALPPWEASADEILAVMDATGSERATILGFLVPWWRRLSGSPASRV
jgi:pimeloyl-ACP methyl ester carboxylesterase